MANMNLNPIMKMANMNLNLIIKGLVVVILSPIALMAVLLVYDLATSSASHMGKVVTMLFL